MAIRFVEDKAAEADKFGGHTRVAKTLAKLLDRDSGVKTIGLVGSWGSGKSTAFHLASKELISNSKKVDATIFVFDAWQHQSDPPRRAFIQSLIDFLSDQSGLPVDTWKADIEEVTRRVETHDISNTPSLTPWGVAIAMSILLLPLGIRMTSGEGWVAVSGWIFTLLPFALAAANWWWWRPIRNVLNDTWFFFQKDNFSINRHPYEDKSIVSVFVNKSVDKTTNRIVKTPETTSIEFRDLFYSVIGRCYPERKNYIFVLDNLDRVNEEDATNIWAALRSLLSYPSDKYLSEVQFKLVIPLDYNSLYRLFDKEDPPSPSTKSRVQSLLDKSFDVVLRVTPPVATGWRSYLDDMIDYALGDNSTESHKYAAATIFAGACEKFNTTNSITPRSLNSYVNEIALLYEQRGNDVSFVSICYYVAFSHRGEQFDIGEVIGKSGGATAAIERLDPDWRKNVSAIHFGVEVENALQLLLGDQVVSAINAADQAAFNTLASVKGFELVLEQQLGLTQPRTAEFFANAAALVSNSTLPADLEASVWEAILKGAESFVSWTKLSDVTATGLAAIAAKGRAKPNAAIYQSLSNPDQEFEEEGEVWLKNLIAAVAATPVAQRPAQGKVSVPYGSEYYLSVIEAGVKLRSPVPLAPLLRTANPVADVQDKFVTKAKNRSFDAGIGQEWTLLNATAQKWDWANLFASIEEAVSQSASPQLGQNALNLLIRLEPKPETTLATLGRRGRIANLFQMAVSTNSAVFQGSVVAATALGWPNLSLDEHFEQSGSGQNHLANLDALSAQQRDTLVEEAAKLVAKSPANMLKGFMVWARDYTGSRNTILRIVDKAFARGAVTRLHTSSMIAHIDMLLDKNAQPYGARIASRSTGYGEFWTDEAKKLSNDQLPRLLSVVLPFPEAALPLLQERLVKIGGAEAADQFRNPNSLVSFALRLNAQTKRLDLDAPIEEAAITLANGLANGSVDPATSPMDWASIFAALGAQQLAEHVVELMTTFDNQARVRVIEGLGLGFFTQPQVVKLGEMFASKVLLPILIEQLPIASALIDILTANDSKLVRKARKPTRKALGDKLVALNKAGLLEDGLLKSLMGAWNLPV